MRLTESEIDVQESEERIAQLKHDRDAALAVPGQETRAADLNEALMQEERLLEHRKKMAAPKKLLGDVPTRELNGDDSPLARE